jgi:hypothetical protein
MPNQSGVANMRATDLGEQVAEPVLGFLTQVNAREHLDHDFATILDRRLKRIEEMKAKEIEAKPVISGEKVDARLPPRLADCRFRRI